MTLSKIHSTKTMTLLLVLLLFSSCNIIQAATTSIRGKPVPKRPYRAKKSKSIYAPNPPSSGSGAGGCVYIGNYNKYKSTIDNRARVGILYLYGQLVPEDFLNYYFEGYVCPCESVCGEYTTFDEFLNGYCSNRFVMLDQPSDATTLYPACQNFVRNVCDYPELCT
jgi:hypothetical protein